MIQPFVMKKEMLFEGALDFSFLLDPPAGKHGFVRIEDGHFYLGGERIRFFGYNIAFNHPFSRKQDIDIIAERLARAGVNFVRFHGVDAQFRRGEHLLIDYAKGNSRNFDPEQWDRLDYFFACVKEKGIYIQLDLNVGRRYLPGDGLDYPDDMMKYFKQAGVYNRRLMELQKEYADAYLTHVNPNTGLRYIDDPAVVLVQVMNENGVFWYESRDDVGLPGYSAELDRRFGWFLLGKYGSRRALDAAWTNAGGTRALLDDEDPALGTVRRVKHLEGTQMYVDFAAPYRGAASPARYADYVEFLEGLQLNFAREMREHLLALGVKCPVNISNHAQGAADIYSLDRYADVNMDNAYWNHPDTVNQSEPRYHAINMVENDPRRTVVDSAFKLNLVTRLNHDRVAGKPFIAGEWNILYGTDFRSDAMPMVAAYACLQDWDGLVLYAYHHESSMERYDDTRLDGPFNLHNDPATWGMTGLCSFILQRGLVRAGKHRLEVCYTEQDRHAVPRNWIAPYGYASYVSQVAARFIGAAYEGGADAALASGNTPTGDYTKAARAFVFSRGEYADGAMRYPALARFLALHRASGERCAVVEDGRALDADYRGYSRALDAALKRWGLLGGGQGLVDDGALVSDTDELSFDFAHGVFRADAPGLKVASGNIRGGVALGRYRFEVNNERMTLALVSLDGRPTDESAHLLLVALGWCGNLDMKFEPQADGYRVMRDAGHGPVSVDSLEGSLTLPAGRAVYPLNPDGSRMERLKGNGAVAFVGEGTMFFEIG